MAALLKKIWDDPATLITFISLSALIRIVGLGRNSLWFDEAVSYLTAELPLNQILNNTIQSSHPPLYYLLLKFWLPLSGNTDAGLRGLSLLFGLLLITVIYFLALELFDDNQTTAVWAAFLAALSPFMALYSHELRMYTLLAFLVALGTLIYLYAIKDNDKRWWALFLVVFLLATYTHLFAWLPLGAIGLYALIKRQNREALKWTVICIGLLALLFIPWAMILLGESDSDLGSIRPLAQPDVSANPLKPLTSLAFLLFGQSTRYPIVTGIALFLALSLVVIFLIDGRKAIKEKATTGLLLPLLISALTIGLPVLLFLIRPFFLPERTLAAALPSLILLLAWGTTRRQSPLPYLIGIAAVFMLVTTFFYLTGDPVKPPYRQAMEFVDQQRQPGDAVLHTSDGSYFPALRYVDFDPHGLLAGDPDPRKPLPVYQAVGGEVWTLEETTTKGSRLWLVVALEHSNDWQVEQANYFDQRYQLLQRYDFDEINVLLYDLGNIIVNTNTSPPSKKPTPSLSTAHHSLPTNHYPLSINSMSYWPILIAVGLATFATRLSFILLFGRISVPPGLHRALRFVPPAALTAIILPELLIRNDAIDISLNNYRLIAGLLAILVAWRTKNIFLTIIIGMAALLLMQAFGQ